MTENGSNPNFTSPIFFKIETTSIADFGEYGPQTLSHGTPTVVPMCARLMQR